MLETNYYAAAVAIATATTTTTTTTIKRVINEVNGIGQLILRSPTLEILQCNS